MKDGTLTAEQIQEAMRLIKAHPLPDMIDIPVERWERFCRLWEGHFKAEGLDLPLLDNRV